MSSSFRTEQWVHNIPIKVRMAGWESDTQILQLEGWQISAEQDVRYMSLRIAIHHPVLKLSSISDHLDVDYMRTGHDRMEMLQRLVLNMQMVSSRLIVRHQIHTTPMSQFLPVDCAPTGAQLFSNTTAETETNIENFYIFKPIPKEGLIVRPDSVPELMDKILALQDPKMKELISKQRERESRQQFDSPPVKINNHCNIISIAT